jgi:hypothetical protein
MKNFCHRIYTFFGDFFNVFENFCFGTCFKFLCTSVTTFYNVFFFLALCILATLFLCVCIHIKIPHPSESGSDQSVEVLILLSEILINDCI